MSQFIKNNKGELVEVPPYKCKMCGMYEVEFSHDICNICGWQDDIVQNEQTDYIGGANDMSFNQYRKFWEENREEILKKQNKNCFVAIDMSQAYYEKHFENKNEEGVKNR